MNTEKTTKRNHENKTRRADDNQNFPPRKRARLVPVGARGNFRQQLRSFAMTACLLAFAGSAVGCDKLAGDVHEMSVAVNEQRQVDAAKKVEEAEALCQGAGLELDKIEFNYTMRATFTCRKLGDFAPR